MTASRRPGPAVGLALLVRISLVTISLVTVSLVPGAAGATELADKPPHRVDQMKLDVTESTQVEPGRWVTTTATPRLFAYPTDPNRHDWLTVTWQVRDGSSVVWKRTTAAAPPKSWHQTVVPEGVLSHGVEYTLRVRAEDETGLRSPRWSKPLRIEVDTVSPTTEPDVHTVAGQPAEYEEDTWSGGVGLQGKFYFTNGGDDTVVRYRWGWSCDVLTGVVAAKPGHPRGKSGKITFVPEEPGPHELCVHGLDEAGRYSPERHYMIWVNYPGELGDWALDEGTGSHAADDSGSDNHLTLSASTTWADGLYTSGLLFDELPDDASSSAAVIDTSDGFAVTAFVRLSSDGADAVAVSQDGEHTSAFELGYVRDDACPESGPSQTEGCFAFGMATEDTPGAPVARALSPIPASVDEWYLIAGVYDTRADEGHELSIYVCTAELADLELASVGHQSTWQSTGQLHLGRGLDDGAPAHGWHGVIDRVHAYDAAISADDVFDVCVSG